MEFGRIDNINMPDIHGGKSEITPSKEAQEEFDRHLEDDKIAYVQAVSDGQDRLPLDEANREFDALFEGEENLDIIVDAYFDDLKSKSEFPETISDKPFEPSDLKKLSPEENAEMREEFSEKREQMKREWEETSGYSWPKYEHDIYSSGGKLIRQAGSDYDAHHIQPLGMGGKNEASNITPLHAEVHYDKQGVHAQGSPYSRLDLMIGGTD